MSRLTVTRTINSPIDKVFDTIAHIDNFSKAVPHITKVELISDTKSGVGTRFRETRLMKGREATCELEVTEYVRNDHVRIVSDEGGAVWDSVFKVTRVDDSTTDLELTMDARPHKLAAKMITPLIMGMIKKAVAGDLEHVKTYCEQETPA